MSEVRIVDNVEAGKWNELLENCNEATIFQTKEMLDALQCSNPNHKIRYIIAEEDGKIVCGMPIIDKKRRWFHEYVTPDWGSPVVSSEGMNKLDEILKCFASLNGIRILAMDYFDKCQTLLNLGFSVRQCECQILELERPFENMFKTKISKSRRKNAAAAIRRGVTLEEVTAMQQVREYYEMAQYTYGLHGGKLPYSLAFYESIFNNMLNKNLAKWHLARKGDKAIAGTLHFTYKGMVFDMLNTSYREYQELRANDLLVYNMIKWACENGYKYYSFGSSGDAKSLMHFKQIWGGQSFTFPIYEKSNLTYRIGKKLLQIGKIAK